MPPSRIDNLLQRQASQLASLEDAEVARVLRAYDDARRALREELTTMTRLGLDLRTPATAQHLRVMLAQTESGIADLRTRLGQALAEGEIQAHAKGLQHLLDVIKEAEPKFRDTGGGIEVQALRALVEERALLLHRYSIDRYGAQVAEAIQRELAAGIARGLTVTQLAERVAGTGSSVFEQFRGRAMLVARMETSRAYNLAHQRGLEAAYDDDDLGDVDPLLKKADEAFDVRNNPFSRALHGRVAPVRGEWVVPLAAVRDAEKTMGRPASGVVWRRDGDTYRGASYPAHFNDRGRLVPWRASWGPFVGPLPEKA